ncbi:hypothetical protein HGRIS_011168 [Hohenbuehelia grisea]|uniref:Uncharacterized protein n=1 Tax=Hohenbuehelia grisea TaxID=104357 RepID=A0ABR3JV31_9AGAR
MTSLAALLMHYPLTVYHLSSCASQHAGRQRPAKTFCVHYLGALNFFPLFSEVALLIPNADIEPSLSPITSDNRFASHRRRRLACCPSHSRPPSNTSSISGCIRLIRRKEKVAMNPFAKPGQRVIMDDSFRMPSMVNGFSMAVYAEI